MEIKNENRWEIKRIGLINYWWYDEEIFEFSEGRMILRGTNGSGKSVTMQSFIPLLLDGRKTPERLDPFGNKSRKIEEYILGYGENIKEENTSYLFMEFGKKETGNYITIGIGLRAKKGQNVSFWGFIIKDGRRIGKDFYLYKNLDQKITLTKQELKNKIGEGGRVVETQKEYMSLVNDEIFGFSTLEEYDEFIKLLIEIRSPKLSNGKDFRPSVITEIISNSLIPLSDEDLRPVTESIKNMNNTKEQLDSLRKSNEAIEKLNGYYKTYNEAVLYQKAKNYKNSYNDFKKEEEKEKILAQKIEELKEEINLNKEKQNEIIVQIKSNEFTLEELRKDERFDLQNKLEKIKQEIEEKSKEIEKDEAKKEERKKEENRNQAKEKEAKEEKEKLETEFKEKEKQTKELADTIKYDEYLFRIEEIKENIEKPYKYEPLNNDIKRYIQKINNGKIAIEKAKRAEQEYDISQQEVDKKRADIASKEQEITKGRIILNEEKEKYKEEMYKWELKNEEFKITQEDKIAISQKVEEYGEKGTIDDIIAEYRKPYEKIKEEILIAESNIKADKENKVKEKQDILNQIEEWKNQKEAEPERLEAVKENRKKLMQKNIAYIPLYEAIDFKKEITENQKDILENAMLDMGLLDAIILEKEDLSEVKKQDKNFIDKYLTNCTPKMGNSVLEYFDIIIPKDCKIKTNTISNILSNIQITEENEELLGNLASIDKQGNYQIGLLGGKTSQTEKAKYIGKEAKRRYKEEQIAKLSKLSNDKDIEIQQMQEDLQKQQARKEKLEAEWKCIPQMQELEEKQNKIKRDINILQAIKEELELKEETLKIKFEELKKTQEVQNEATKGIYFTKTLEVFEENLKLANELKDEISEIEKIQIKIVSIVEKLNTIKEQKEEIISDIDELQYKINQANLKIKTMESNKASIEEMLGTDFKEMQAKMEKCIKLSKELPEQKEELIKIIERLETTKANDIIKLTEKEAVIAKLQKQSLLYKEIFEQELELKYVIAEPQDTKTAMQQIITKYHTFEEKNKTTSDYLDTLSIKFRENLVYLLEYNLSIEDININQNEEEYKNMPEELKEVEKTRNRRDITGYLKGRKVNLNVLAQDIKETIEETESLIEEDDRKLFEDILTNTVGRKIREKIYHSKNWVKKMSDLMENINTSSGLTFSLRWKPKIATDETEVDTAELVEILNSDTSILKQEEIKKVANHFRSKFAKAEQKSKEKGNLISFENIMKETLDYRSWFEFEFLHKQGTGLKKQLTNNAFYKLSGGEKAMAMYIPLFAAVYAKYENSKKDSPRIISLDEAFAGVDDNNIRDCFRILTELDLEYIINSQVLWGEYDTIPSLAINELVSDPSSQVVSVIRYRWNGKKKELLI